METRQLALFVLACQHLSHADAAVRAGLSPSSLSEAVSALEDELGLPLFSRGPFGHAPSEAARWLFQRATLLLQLIEAAAAPASGRGISILRVESSLEFMFGRLSRAAALSVRRLRKRQPGIFAQVRFHPPFFPAPEETDSADVLLTYGEPDRKDGILLYTDDWIGVSGTTEERGAGSIAGMRVRKLWLPPLAHAQDCQIRAYCEAWGLQQPWLLEGEGDTLDLFARKGPDALLLAPRSLIGAGLARSRLAPVQLDEPLYTPVVARIETADDGKRVAARRFVRSLAAYLSLAPRRLEYSPAITLRQLRYFQLLATLGNMSEASRRLNVAQPALSVQLRKLEEALGEPLFLRTRHGMTAVPSARSRINLLIKAAEVAERIRSEARNLSDTQRCRVTLGISSLVSALPVLRKALTDAVADFRLEAGDVHIRLFEFPAGELFRRLRTGAIGLGICETGDNDLLCQPLSELGVLGLVMNRSVFPEIASGMVTLRDAATLPLVLPSRNEGLRIIVDRLSRSAAVTLASEIEVASLAAGVSLAGSCGLALFTPQGLLPHIDAGKDMNFVSVMPRTTIRLQVLAHPDRPLSALEARLLDHVRRHFAAEGRLSPPGS